MQPQNQPITPGNEQLVTSTPTSPTPITGATVSSPEPPSAASAPPTNEPVSTDVSVSAELPVSQSRLFGFFGIVGIRALILIPHLVAIYILIIISGVLSFINFFIILFTGKSSAPLHKFMVGTLRWSTRVSGYSMGVTDKYPPFKLEE